MSYLSTPKHPSLTNIKGVKLGNDTEFQKTLASLFAFAKAPKATTKGPTTPLVGPTLPSTLQAMNGTLASTLDKGTTGSGKSIKLGPQASTIAQGQNPFTQAPAQQPTPAPRVDSIFTQPQAQPTPTPQVSAPALQAPQFLGPVSSMIGAPPPM